jgi:hypothetical protein
MIQTVDCGTVSVKKMLTNVLKEEKFYSLTLILSMKSQPLNIQVIRPAAAVVVKMLRADR